LSVIEPDVCPSVRPPRHRGESGARAKHQASIRKDRRWMYAIYPDMIQPEGGEFIDILHQQSFRDRETSRQDRP